MAVKIEAWKSNSGHLFEKESEARVHDARTQLREIFDRERGSMSPESFIEILLANPKKVTKAFQCLPE
jgi:hypothetical protein